MNEKTKQEYVETKYIDLLDEFKLESGKILKNIRLAYETYGVLNKSKSNAIYIFHALSGDAHVSGYHKNSAKPGWWDTMVGPGKGIDTNKFYVICSNVIGGCKGSTGPNSINPETKNNYGSDFPIITIKDMVAVQKIFIGKLEIKKLHSIIGGSMGGMQALQFAVNYPGLSKSVIVIASAASQPPQGIAFHEVGRQAIMRDPYWNRGNYYLSNNKPETGLSIARMIAHITYLSESSMKEKFGRRLQAKKALEYSLETEFQIESYLKHQGLAFVDRFDANSYLYITRAIDYFDLGNGINLSEKFKDSKAKWLVLSIDTDWLYTTEMSKEIVNALRLNHLDVTFYEHDCKFGHDGFLLKDNRLSNILKSFIERGIK
jgi:homoserine O-acetyltransferase/O-succinyltransferase